MVATERRKQDRLTLAIPVRVLGYLAAGGSWEEISTTTDVSSTGASFSLRHPVELGQVLRLSLGLPKRLRQYDLSDVSYLVYSLVRFVHRAGEQPRVGVMFYGKHPPRGFRDNPAGRYLLPGDPMPVKGKPAATAGAAATGSPADPPPAAAASSPAPAASSPAAADPPSASPAPEFLPTEWPQKDRRSSPRVERFVNFMLQSTDGKGNVLQQELTVADNVGRGGARVMTTLPFKAGEVVLLQEAGGSFKTRAEVRGVTRVQPAYARLHLRFVDCEAPDRLLR